MFFLEELGCTRFADSLSEPHRRQLAIMGWLKECEEGTVLFEEEQDSPFIYCVLKGQVSLRVQEPYGESVEVDRVGPGELLGWSPVFGRHAMTATAVATSPCRLAVFEVSRIVELCERDPKFALAFLCQVGLHVSARLRSTRQALALARTISHHSPYMLREEAMDGVDAPGTGWDKVKSSCRHSG
jgi:CRP-like cAMP-binding protein